MTAADEIVPDSERRGFIGALPPRLRPYASLMRLDRPIGSWLLYWPCAWSVALAGVDGRWDLFLWLFLGAFAMRSAGCVYNDIVDRDLDARVERTRTRPLASGRVSVRAAWALVVGLSLVGLIVLRPVLRGAGVDRTEDERRATLEAAKEAKYREIRDAELDYRMGKLSEADWRATDGELRAQAVEILRAIDELPTADDPDPAEAGR